jgi:deoxyribonuclease V
MKRSTSSSSQALRFFARLQEALARVAYPVEDRLGRVERVCAVDTAYSGEFCAAAAVVYDVSSGETVEEKVMQFRGRRTPYIPGFLILREGPPLLETLETVTNTYDLLLVDGHGRAHPRRCGLATMLGFVAGRASVGVAKSLLTGVVRDTEVVDGGEVVGLAGRKAYYSQGYGVSFNDLRKVYEMFGGGYPEALRHADKLSKTAVKK